MRFILLTLLLFIIFMSCHRQSMPVITERKSAPPRIISIYPAPGTIVPDTIQGKQVFINRCNHCHGLPSTAEYSITRWEGILELMIPRAGINQENAVHLRAYVLAKAGK